MYACRCAQFVPWIMPLGKLSPLGTASPSFLSEAGILKTTQWVTDTRMGASKSTAVNAKLLVPSGGSPQDKGGERFSPSRV